MALGGATKMKALFVHNFYQQFGGEDGAYLADKRLVAEYAAGKVDVVTYERHNDEIKDWTLAKRLRFAADTISSQQTRLDIARIVQAEKPDLAYVHNLYPLISPSLYYALREHRVPIVQMAHTFRWLCPNAWFYTQGQVCERCKLGNTLHAVRHRCYKDSYVLSAIYAASVASARRAGVLEMADAFVVPSAFMIQKFVDAGVAPERIHVKPHYIDAPTPDVSSTPGSYVLYMGRLSAEKGLRTLLRAFHQLPDIPLRIAGQGPLEQELRKYVEQHGLKQISFEGFVTGERKERLLREARLVVAPSECYETFGLIVLEAYAQAKPVVASRIGSFPNLIEESRTGLLATAGDPGSLAVAVRSVYGDPAACRAMGLRGRQLAESQYGPAQNASLLLKIFEAVRLGSPTAPARRDMR
jgi:glycosyltransferase involved in cell wall biosynthesis